MAIPEFLKEKLKKQYGNDLKDKILEGFTVKRKVTFRVNTLKSNIQEVEEVLNSNKKVLVEFYADWCEACETLEPVLEEVAKENLDLKVVKINVENNISNILFFIFIPFRNNCFKLMIFH